MHLDEVTLQLWRSCDRTDGEWVPRSWWLEIACAGGLRQDIVSNV
jgi:hypothetical protein